MIRRFSIGVLLAIQALGGGAITLAHARDVVDAQPGVEAGHDDRCAILHDELRCALCHYAGARVVVQQLFLAPVAPVARVRFSRAPSVVGPTAAARRTTRARAPPLFLS